MGFKDELKRGMSDAMKDVNKTWKIDYKGHCVEIIHQLKEECLIIDGTTVDTNNYQNRQCYGAR